MERKIVDRREVIRMVEDGELSPAQAERIARQNKWGGFEIKPAASAFDPSRQPWWTLAMAVAWIVWRDYEYVRKVWSDYRKACWVWRPSSRLSRGILVARARSIRAGTMIEDDFLKPIAAYYYENPADVSAFDVVAIASHSSTVRTSGEAALGEVLEKLQDGELSALGIKVSETEYSTIPAIAWTELNHCRAGGGWAAEDIGNKSDKCPRYRKVKVQRKNVLELWGPLPDPILPSSSEKDEYARWINRHQGKRPPSRDSDFEHMRGRFPGISVKEVRGLRAKHAPADWKKRGRRRNDE
jgi:hypothetical protein